LIPTQVDSYNRAALAAFSGGERETFFDLERLVTLRLSLDSREEECILLSILQRREREMAKRGCLDEECIERAGRDGR